MDKHDHLCLSVTPMYSREGNALASSHIMVGLLPLLLSAALTAAAPKPFSGSGSAYIVAINTIIGHHRDEGGVRAGVY